MPYVRFVIDRTGHKFYNSKHPSILKPTKQGAIIMNLEQRKRPFSVNEIDYPFKDHWFEGDGVAMHYIDEGEGMPGTICKKITLSALRRV
jgi:hypothetical protein